MLRSAPSLLSRLRRHRGLWVLAVAVLLIKPTTGTLCLTDGPGNRVAVASTTIMAISDPVVNTASIDAVINDAGDSTPTA